MIVLHGTAGITVLAAGMLFTITPVLIHTGLIRSKRKKRGGGGGVQGIPEVYVLLSIPCTASNRGKSSTT